MSAPSTLSSRRLPESATQVIKRDVTLTFSFDGKQYSAYAGDTIASALAAAGVTTFSRSFKYHRKRGLLCVAGNCPNCLVQIGDEPNVRSCTTPVTEGLVVEAQNAFPSLGTDVMSLTQMVDRFLPAGFYYKTFIRPRAMWGIYERFLRNAAGLGKVAAESEAGRFDKKYLHADVTIVGGGPAGMQAALSAAATGARVILMDEQSELGGHLRYFDPDTARPLVDAIHDAENITLLRETLAFGRYDHNWIGAYQGDCLLKLRTKSLVVATGAYEIPMLFENNDLPGVMLASGVARLIKLWGVPPGSEAVVVTANPRGHQVADDLREAGINVKAVAELPQARVLKANGRGRVESVTLQSDGQTQEIECDLLVLATGFAPASGILFQAGAKLVWDERLNEFVPMSLPDRVFAAGEAAATHDPVAIIREGELAGIDAALAAGFGDDPLKQRAASLRAEVDQHRKNRVTWTHHPLQPDAGKHDFVCLCEDVTRKDIKQSIDEGYKSVELLKRYSTVSMGPCQGKMCNVSAMQLCAHYNDQTIAETGTTTSRPPIRPVTLGALGGRLMEPVRVSPMHDWHLARGAKMMNAGLWKRPEHYGDIHAEVRAVRQRVGLIDVTPLGKFHVQGPDARNLLERVYTNRWQKLALGRVRYGVMVNEEGIITDDGVTARIDDDFYYMTATSSGASSAYEYIQWWLQSGWQMDVSLTNATDLRAAMNLAGPRSRDVLTTVAEGVDLSNEAFPYMGVREATVAGVPALLMRIGFTGELSYEIHVPSGYGLRVWKAIMDAGEAFGIAPFGVEAQRTLRLEKGHFIVGQDTDALTNPFEADAEWVVKLDKADFLGKPSLQRANEAGITQKLVGFEMPDATLPEEANQIVRPGDGPIGLEIIGRVTSARFSPTLDKVIGLCWLPVEMTEPGIEFSVRVRGQLKTGRVLHHPFYDPDGDKLRS